MIKNPWFLPRDAVDKGLSRNEALPHLEILKCDATQDGRSGSPIDSTSVHANTQIGLHIPAWHTPILGNLRQRIDPMSGVVALRLFRIGFIRGGKDNRIVLTVAQHLGQWIVLVFSKGSACIFSEQFSTVYNAIFQPEPAQPLIVSHGRRDGEFLQRRTVLFRKSSKPQLVGTITIDGSNQ